MTTNYNLNSHYTSNPKVERPQKTIVSPPNNLPVKHLYSDRDANNRMKFINNDIYQGFKQEKQKEDISFTKIFLGAMFAVLAFLGIKKVFK